MLGHLGEHFLQFLILLHVKYIIVIELKTRNKKFEDNNNTNTIILFV